MSQFIVVDGINTTLADAVTTTDTSITLASSANLPTLLAGQILPLIVQSASNASAYEIMYGTAISGAEITVTRGMEGPTAQAFNVGDYVLCGPTAGSNALIRAVMNPAVSTTLPQAYGAAVLPSGLSGAITLTLPNAVPAGTSYVIYGASSYAVTVAVSVSSGSPSIGLPDGSYVFSWTIPASGGYQQGIRIDFDGTNWEAQTFGQTVVAPATQINAAVQLNQLFIGNRKAVFTANGNFTIPSFVSTIWVSGCAGGGGGGSGAGAESNPGSGGGGGGAGQSVIRQAFSVAGGDSLSISIGAGAAGGAGGSAGDGYSGGNGGATIITNTTTSTTLLSLTAGSGGGAGINAPDGTCAGGTGGTGYPYGSYGMDGGNDIYGSSGGGVGASGPFGGGGGSGRGGNNGGLGAFPAYGYGAGGGGGGGSYSANSGNGAAGGSGAPGILIIEW